jgi:hypothetical protein
MTARAALALLCLLAGTGCQRSNRSNPVDAAGAPVRGVPEAETASSLGPAYPEEHLPDDPAARRLCEALHGLVAARRLACCGHKGGLVLTSECARLVSAALRLKSIRLDPEKVATCARERGASLDGCDWVGPNVPQPPASCAEAMIGLTTKGKPCRSSLECVSGLSCRGARPTALGTCEEARVAGVCGSVDPLAPFVLVTDVDARHPECTGRCDRHACVAAPLPGGACASPAACARGNRCVDGKCVAGAVGEAGQRCTGGGCARGLRCQASVCVHPAEKGTPCSTDLDCQGGCLKRPSDKRGICGPRC